MSFKGKRLAIHIAIYKLDRKTYRTDQDLGTMVSCITVAEDTVLVRFLKATGLRGPSVNCIPTLCFLPFSYAFPLISPFHNAR